MIVKPATQAPLSMLALADGGVVGLETAAGVLPVDLIVDATGRAARGAEWPARCGVRVPPRDRVSVDGCYTAVDVELDPVDLMHPRIASRVLGRRAPARHATRSAVRSGRV